MSDGQVERTRDLLPAYLVLAKDLPGLKDNPVALKQKLESQDRRIREKAVNLMIQRNEKEALLAIIRHAHDQLTLDQRRRIIKSLLNRKDDAETMKELVLEGDFQQDLVWACNEIIKRMVRRDSPVPAYIHDILSTFKPVDIRNLFGEFISFEEFGAKYNYGNNLNRSLSVSEHLLPKFFPLCEDDDQKITALVEVFNPWIKRRFTAHSGLFYQGELIIDLPLGKIVDKTKDINTVYNVFTYALIGTIEGGCYDDAKLLRPKCAEQVIGALLKEENAWKRHVCFKSCNVLDILSYKKMDQSGQISTPYSDDPIIGRACFLMRLYRWAENELEYSKWYFEWIAKEEKINLQEILKGRSTKTLYHKLALKHVEQNVIPQMSKEDLRVLLPLQFIPKAVLSLSDLPWKSRLIITERLRGLCERRYPKHLLHPCQFDRFPSRLATFYNNERFSDVEFFVGGKTYYAHKAVICGVGYFKSLLQVQQKEKQPIKLNKNVDPEVFEAYLRFAYTGTITHESLKKEKGLKGLKLFPKMLDSEEYSDVSIKTKDGKTIHCHRIILAAASKYFSKVLVENKIIDQSAEKENFVGKDGKQLDDALLKDLLSHFYRGNLSKISFENDAAKKDLVALLDFYQSSWTGVPSEGFLKDCKLLGDD